MSYEQESHLHITVHGFPLTAAIPYNYRWRIMNLKLMLRDLKELADKYDIAAAKVLYDAVAKETNELCSRLTSLIIEKETERAKWKAGEE